MKIKALVFATVAAVSLGIAGAASAATPAPAANQAVPAIAFNQTNNGVVQAGLVLRFGFYPGYRFGYYRRHRRCRRFYYLGFVRGIPFYRHLYYRFCRYHHYY
jgi:hypothetical protein